MRLWRSLTFRLALVYMGLFALSVGIIFVGLYVIGVARPLQLMEAQVEAEASALVETYIIEGPAGLIAQLEARAAQTSAQRAFHAFLDRDGRKLATNLPSWPGRQSSGWLRIEADLYVDGNEDDHEALARDHVFADGARLLVGRDIDFIDEREEFLREAALWAAIITLLLGITGGVMMSLAVGHRIDAVTRTARRVIAGNFSERVPIKGRGDDFDQLSETLNLMLVRIEELVESVRRVSDSVAHELRTPLARLQVDLYELEHATEGEERDRLARQAGAEAARLQSVFDALLRIARIESGRHHPGLRAVDLTTLLNDAIEYHLPAAECRQQQLCARVDPDLMVEADPHLIFQAVSNLLDNALKYTPASGTVTLVGQRVGDEISIGVLDDGAGIPLEHLDKVTERFYRVPATNTLPGLGLGLSLVSAIATLHHGTLRLGNKVGLHAEIRLPSADRVANG